MIKIVRKLRANCNANHCGIFTMLVRLIAYGGYLVLLINDWIVTHGNKTFYVQKVLYSTTNPTDPMS